jgi:DNA polymerase-3 subunit gamma/tau
LSRCQRFDLSRVSIEDLNKLYKKISKLENVNYEDEAISLISKGADGSVRDGLSLLDQAISLSEGMITSNQIHSMLGFTDFSKIIELYEYTMKGDAENAMNLLEKLYNKGVSPNVILQDLIDFNHFISKIKASSNILENTILSEDEKQKGLVLSNVLSMNTLIRTWQILLKGVEELNYSPNQYYSLDMIVIKLLYISDMPSPSDLIKQVDELKKKPNVIASENVSVKTSETVEQNNTSPNSFMEVVNLFGKNKEVIIFGKLQHSVNLVSFEQGKIKLKLNNGLNKEFLKEVSKKLSLFTGENWVIEESKDIGEMSIMEQQIKAYEKEKNEISKEDNIASIFEVFPSAEIKKIEKYK